MSYGTVQAEKMTTESGYSLGAGNASSFKNRIINGGMVISQAAAGAAVAGATGTIFGVDRTLVGVFGSGTGRMSAQRSSTAPSGTQFVNSLVATVTTADASPTSEFGYCMRQMIEGYNFADFRFGTASAASLTLSFWVRSSIAGTYAVCFQNVDVTRAYTATYTINAADTFEFKTITIVGDTSGTWETTNLMGFSVVWCLGGGSNRQAPAPTFGAWGAGQASGNTITDASGCVDFIGTSGATFYVTGVQVEKGTVATSFDYRPYGTELALCQRYYYHWSPAGTICYGPTMHNITAVDTYGVFFLPVQMRTTPTLTTQGTATNYGAYQGGTQITCNAVPYMDTSNIQTPLINFKFASVLTVGGTALVRGTGSVGFLGFNAEL